MEQNLINRRAFLASLGGAALLAACSSDSAEKPAASATALASPSSNPTTSTEITPAPGGQQDPALEEMIGQLLMVGFRGIDVSASPGTAQAITAGRLGNTVYFDVDLPSASDLRNIQSPAQVASLSSSLQTASSTPLLIATDQEGGLVARLGPARGFPATIAPDKLGLRNDTEFTRDYSRTMASTLAAAGINLNLAPVVDVNFNPENPVIGEFGRSFSADPEAVTAQAAAFIEGHHEAGVLCCLKHFPGHGSSRDDSHLGFVDVTPYWRREELIPFQRLIQQGLADAVMTAHIFNANLDPTYPATLSRATLQGLLRDELGFEGVVITDDMQMGAIRDLYGFEEAIELTLNAGADLIAIANNTTSYETDAAGRAFRAIHNAVTAGRVDISRVRQAYTRVMLLKSRLG